MTHQLVLHIHGTDPLAARFYQILRAIDDADVAVLVEACDVAGAQPTVGGELVGLLRHCVVSAGDEVAATLYLADALAIPRLLFVAFANDAQIDQRRGNAGSCRETD